MLFRLKSLLEKLLAGGSNVECPCCNRRARRFFSAGVVNKRPYARCAYCGSLERHRLIALMLKSNPINNGAKILCIAPEDPLTNFLVKQYGAQITTSDLLRTDVDVQADVCALPFTEGLFDMVIANHVLEHVADDIKAMHELRRVLKINGRAILQTPINWHEQKTSEDLTATPSERLRRFGQADHVRLYGSDIIYKLKNIGWEVKTVEVAKNFSVVEIKKYGLESNEVFINLVK